MLAAVLAVAGCVSVPSAGPVLSYPVTQQTSGQNGQNLQVIARGPGANWKPSDIVTGFLTAAAAIGDQQVAREYLTPQASKSWNPSWPNAWVYKTGPRRPEPDLPVAADETQAGRQEHREGRQAGAAGRRRSWSTATSRRA